MRFFVLVVFVFYGIVSSAIAFAQTDFSKWDRYELAGPAGTELLSPAGGPLIRMHTYPVSGLEEQARGKLDKFGASPQEKIDYALSVLSLSMYWDESFDGQQLSGLVQASDGVYSFKASLSPDAQELTLAMVATDDKGAVLQGASAEARRKPGAATSASTGKIAAAKTSRAAEPQAVKPTASVARSLQNYRAPETVREMDNWASSGKLTKALNPKDPMSPRYYLAQTGPKYGVTDFASAIDKLQTVSELKLKGRPTVELLDAWRLYDGSKAGLVIQQTDFRGTPGVIILYMTQKKGQRDIVYFGYEVTEATYLKWGGVTRMMKLRRVIPSIDAFPKSTRDRISRAPFKQQANVYEAALNKVLEKGAANMFAMSQAQSVMRMRELNYDLLLGGDITSPMIAD